MSKKTITVSFTQHDVDELQKAIIFKNDKRIFKWEYDGVILNIYAEE